MNAVLAAVLLLLVDLAWAQSEYFHQRQEFPSMPGWQEPGLWRPKWIVDREILTPNGDWQRDRLYLRLKSDRAIEIIDPRKRPWLQWRKEGGKLRALTGKPDKKAKTKRDSEGKEVAGDESELTRSLVSGVQEIVGEAGSWSWKHDAGQSTSQVTMDIADEQLGGRLRYDVRCTWGTMDPYAAKFATGQIYRNNPSRKDGVGAAKVSLLGYPQLVGQFAMYVNPHRPMVSKEFQAFQ